MIRALLISQLLIRMTLMEQLRQAVVKRRAKRRRRRQRRQAMIRLMIKA
jgi:hypothetical protein